MDSIYKYPVFFECDSLLEEQKKKVETYFCIRRRSGGGECGPLTRVADAVYSVVYKHRTDQQTVLRRCEHVVELATGRLVLTVRGSLEPDTSVPFSTTTPRQDFTAPVQSLQSISTATPPPSGEEYELRPDSFLIRYLKECPKALKDLEKELNYVSCSAQLNPEEGRVLVQSLAQPAEVDRVRNWKAQVDKLFDCYLCHYEADPRKVTALLRAGSSHQTKDEVKVYSDEGLAVVVGEHSQVSARLIGVESYTKQGSSPSEKHTSVRRLGKAKLRLLWKDIEHSLGRDFPGVNVTQGDAGELVLEGSVKEILKAGDWIADKGNSVLERTISDMSPHLLDFLKKAYGSQGGLCNFLGVGDDVEVELQDTKLNFFTLRAEKLNDAEYKLKEMFNEVTINIPDCSAVLSELQEKLKSKTNEMNKDQYTVQVVFGTEGTVSILGHTKQVEELSEAIPQLIDPSCVQCPVLLPFPELVQGLPELLRHHKFDYSGVKIHPITSSSEPMVVLEGPCSKVTEVKNKLGSFLDSLVQEIFPTESTTRNGELPNVVENLAKLSLSEVNTIVASYNLLHRLQVLVCQGDITKQDADALVNAANEDLDHCGGVAAALSKAGGPQVQRESNDIAKTGKIPTGEVRVTTGGNLNCKKLLHAVGPVGGKAGAQERVLLGKTVHSALNLAEMMQFESIAIPCIGSSLFGVTVCSEAIVAAVKEFGSQGGRSLSRIILIDNRREVVKAMQDACDQFFRGFNSTDIPSHLGCQKSVSAQETARGATAAATGDCVHVEIIQGTIETQQVDALVSPMVGHDPLSTRVGNTLSKMAEFQLTAMFREQAGEELMMTPGDSVLVEGLPGLPSNAVFFLNLVPWDNDQDGTAVQVLRLGINNILTACKRRGFGSVALPVLGAGAALRFPVSMVARVLLEEVHAFQRERANRAPLLVHIVIYPSDEEATEAFNSANEAFSLNPDQGLTSRRIVLLGKTGAGKSSLANTIFGEDLFTTNHSPNSGTFTCQVETRSVNGKSVTLIDTPGFFDAQRSEEGLKGDIVTCITECSPGPHAFLIVLKVEKFSKQEQEVITKICQCFSEDALKYAVIVFTHGEQLRKGMKIEEFVSQNENLSDLVKKCGGRCHVVDNTYWNIEQQNNYRSNRFHVEGLLNTIDQMVIENNGGCYVNQMFQTVEKEIQKEEASIRQSSRNMPRDMVRAQAKSNVAKRFLIRLTGIATGTLLGALFGMAALVVLAVNDLKNPMELRKDPVVQSAVGLGSVAVAGVEIPVVAVGAAGAAALAGGILGGSVGSEASEGAETMQEAAKMAAEAVLHRGQTALTQLQPSTTRRNQFTQ